MTKEIETNCNRFSILFAGAALTALLVVPMIPADLGSGLTTFGSAQARNGADDGQNGDGHHKGFDDSDHHGGKGKGKDNDKGNDSDSDNDGDHNKGHDKDDHGPNHT